MHENELLFIIEIFNKATDHQQISEFKKKIEKLPRIKDWIEKKKI